LSGGRLILASSSPRRLEILRAHGLDPVVVAPQCAELLDPQLSLEELPSALEHLAWEKAADVMARIDADGAAADDAAAAADSAAAAAADFLVLAADTVVYADGVLGKPDGHGQAVSMLMRLAARSHHVLTAVALVDQRRGQTLQFTDQAVVTFDDYGTQEIEAYLREEPPYDKAGSYAIQGVWRRHAVGIEGDINTVIGLPWLRLAPLLAGVASG